jgi:hypothetical protein
MNTMKNGMEVAILEVYKGKIYIFMDELPH